MKIHVSDLEDDALDWAVAKSVVNPDNWVCEPFRLGFLRNYHPSWDWAQCGPLVDEFNVWCLGRDEDSNAWACGFDGDADKGYGEHKILSIAVCRAIVSAKLGDEIEIPDELVKSI